MKIVDLGHGAIAFEPDEAADRVGSPEVSRLLHASELSDEALDIYHRYSSGKHLASAAPLSRPEKE